jgi:hypothetical protein
MKGISFSEVFSSWKVRLVLGLAAVCVCLLTAGCNFKVESHSLAPAVPETPSAGVGFWQEQIPRQSLVTWAEADLNADNRPDTVIIYRLENNKCQMVIVMNLPEGFRLTVPVQAPVSDQQISFTDFDSKPPEEVVVTGKNGSFAGTAIFRLEKGQIVNLFAEDFDKCCRTGQLKAPLALGM